MPTPLPSDYPQRVYAGVLGKLIGVYLGRPFEQWSHTAIAQKWGEITRYVHQDQGVPLIVSDDDITGTFTFLRALIDHPSGAALTAREIGQTWLNYIAERRHILWWGGIGQSTEHTAFLRLQDGIEAPRSGSIELNGKAVAEEIGAQIFIDGWALVSPGQPEQAARLAAEAARVSHDGEAVHGAVALAVMESLAFQEANIDRLLDAAQRFIPADCEIARMTADVRRWHREDGDWRATLRRIQDTWGYARYSTGCPMVSNHAVILLGLLYGAGDFDRSMMIVNTSGYDTDCNSGNLGCLLGIRNGLDTFRKGFDWRTPLNDRMLVPAADGFRGVQDAATTALEILNLGRTLAGETPLHPEDGARFPFFLPGATHGFAPSELCPKGARAEPVEGGLALTCLAPELRADAEVRTFLSPDDVGGGGYGAAATPTLYPGQVMRARVRAAAANRGPVRVRLFTRTGGPGASLVLQESPETALAPSSSATLEWTVPGNGPWPVCRAGLSASGPSGSTVVLECLDWGGVPRLEFTRPADCPPDWPQPSLISRMFLQSMDHFTGHPDIAFQFAQNRRTGLVHLGCREWRDYRVNAGLRPTLGTYGLAARVQGLTRHYALLAGEDGVARLVRRAHTETVLASAPFPWQPRVFATFELELEGSRITARIDGREIASVRDAEGLDAGGIGFTATAGRAEARNLVIEPLG